MPYFVLYLCPCIMHTAARGLGSSESKDRPENAQPRRPAHFVPAMECARNEQIVSVLLRPSKATSSFGARFATACVLVSARNSPEALGDGHARTPRKTWPTGQEMLVLQRPPSASGTSVLMPDEKESTGALRLPRCFPEGKEATTKTLRLYTVTTATTKPLYNMTS